MITGVLRVNGVGLDLAQHLHAVHAARHVDVQQDQNGSAPLAGKLAAAKDVVQSPLPILKGDNRIADTDAAQIAANQFDVALVVIHDQD
jgi:hypothetical protein